MKCGNCCKLVEAIRKIIKRVDGDWDADSIKSCSDYIRACNRADSMQADAYSEIKEIVMPKGD